MLNKHKLLFKVLCYWGSFCRSIPFYWNTENNKCCSNSDYKPKAALFLYISYFIILSYHGVDIFMFSNSSTRLPPEVQYIFVFAFLAVCPGLIFITNCQRRHVEITKFINGVFQFNTQYQTHTKYTLSLIDLTFVSKLNLCTAYSLAFILMLVPISFIFGLHWIQPCLPSLVGYQLIPNCSKDESNSHLILQSIIKLVIITLNYFVWMIGNSVITFSVAILLIIGPLSAMSFIHT